MTPPAAVRWAARLGWLYSESTPLAGRGHDRVGLAERAEPRQETQRDYPGSLLFLVSGSAINRIANRGRGLWFSARTAAARARPEGAE